MQKEFTLPEFMQNNSAEEIHQRMMNSLPDDIDDMEGGFPFDLTMPAAVEKSEIINFFIVRALMIAFPQYAWDDWLDLHGRQVHIERHEAQKATGYVEVIANEQTTIAKGTRFCTPSEDDYPSIVFETVEDTEIAQNEETKVKVVAVEAGKSSNVSENSVTIMVKPNKAIVSISNKSAIIGGTDREKDGDFFDRIEAEYENSKTYLGNDVDYKRWAKEAGAGDCIVDSAAEGPGTVKLILIDTEGKPAGEKLIQDVYDHIVSESDRSKRLLPTACAHLICTAATTISINYTITGITLEEGTDIAYVRKKFISLIEEIYEQAKENGILRYNDVRPVISNIQGVLDFDEFFVNDSDQNIVFKKEEYPNTGTVSIS